MSKASQRRVAEQNKRARKHGGASNATIKKLIRDGAMLSEYEPASYLRLIGETLPPDTCFNDAPELLAVFERHKPFLATLGKVAYELGSYGDGLPSVPGFLIFDNVEQTPHLPHFEAASLVWRQRADMFDFEGELHKAFETRSCDTIVWVFSTDNFPKVMCCICANKSGDYLTRVLAKDSWVTPRSSKLMPLLLLTEAKVRADDPPEEEIALNELLGALCAYLPDDGDLEQRRLELQKLIRAHVDRAQRPYLCLALTLNAAARDARVAVAKMKSRMDGFAEHLATGARSLEEQTSNLLALATAREAELRAALTRAQAELAAGADGAAAVPLPNRACPEFCV